MEHSPQQIKRQQQSGTAAVRNAAVTGGMVVCLIALSVLALKQRQAAEYEVIGLTNELQQQRVALTASRIQLLLGECARSLTDMAQLDAVIDRSSERTRAELDRTFFNHLPQNECGPLSVFDAEGVLLFSQSSAEPREGQVIDYRTWAANSGNLLTRRSFFGPHRIPTSRSVPEKRSRPIAFELVAPIFYHAGPLGLHEFAGGITFQIGLGDLIRRAEATVQDAAQSYTWIMDSSGILLWQAEHPEMVSNSIRQKEGDKSCLSCHTSFDYLDRILEDQEGVTTYQLNGYPKKLVAYSPMTFENVNWVVATNSSLESITEFQGKSWRQTLLLMIAAVMVLSGGVLLAYRNYHEMLKAEEEAKNWRAKEKLKRKLFQAEQRFRTMIQSAHDLIWTSDGDGRFGFVNLRVEEVTGLNTTALQQQPLSAVVSEGDINKVNKAIAEAWKGNVPEYEIRISSKDGQQHCLSVHTVALQDEGGVVGTVSFGRDVTVQKQAMEALRRKSEQEQVLNSVLRIGLSALTLDDKFDGILEEILSIPWLQFTPRGMIFRLNRETDQLELMAWKNQPEEVVQKCKKVDLGQCLCGISAQEQRLIFASDVDERHEIIYEGMKPHGHFIVPIGSGNKILGVLALYIPAGHVRTQEEESFLKLLANSLAWVIERADAEEALRKSEERYKLASEGARDGLWDWDLVRNEVFYSERWHSMIGLKVDGIGTDPEEWFALVHPDDLSTVRSRLKNHLSQRESHFQCEYRLRHSDGSYRWVFARGLAVRDDTGTPLRIAGSQTDISDRKAIEEKLVHSAFHDALTNLANRALLLDRLGRCLESQRRRADYLFAVMLIDLDQFKAVNDSLGHQAGDRLLSSIAIRLKGLLRDGDTVARLGGDEFAIILTDIGGVKDATRVAIRLNAVLEEPHLIDGHEVFSTASVGIAMSSKSYEHAEDLLRDADTAMYRAKAAGRSNHQVFNIEMHREALAAMTLENDLRRAVNRNEFELYYQPIFSFDGEVVVVEALVRWRHPEMGLLAPGKFIYLAEETDLIVELGEWVLKTACIQIEKWRLLGPHDMRVAVNVSARQFIRRDMKAVVADVLEETGCNPEGLEIELTESCIMGTGESNISTLRDISETGVSIALDDFGTGYSSLFMLKHLPIDVIKIDRAFVISIVKTKKDEAITQAVIAMAHSLGLMVTGEGVENHDQLAVLRRLECDRLQGYLFSSPVSAEDFEHNLSHGWSNIEILKGL